MHAMLQRRGFAAEASPASQDEEEEQREIGTPRVRCTANACSLFLPTRPSVPSPVSMTTFLWCRTMSPLMCEACQPTLWMMSWPEVQWPASIPCRTDHPQQLLPWYRSAATSRKASTMLNHCL